MKRKIMMILCLLSLAAISRAAIQFGLGNAVAKRSATLINKAGAATPLVGDSVAATLPSCPGSAVYDSLPIDLSVIAGIDPLGHVAPSGHTFPSDHVYFYSQSTSTVQHALYAPGHIHVTDVQVTTYLSATPVYSDYAIFFYPCREVESYYAHVRSVSAGLLAAAGSLNQNCYSYSTGGAQVQQCNNNVNVEMQSGDLLGMSAVAGAMDFGTYDSRVNLSFAAPSRHANTNQVHTACPLDYFTDGLKTQMQSLLGRFDGGYRRVTAPLCGRIDFDVAGTAKGDWFFPGAPNVPEDPHLSLIDNNVYAPHQTISVGTSLPNWSTNWYIFVPAGAGQVNRDFSQVTADGLTYCYDTFLDPFEQPAAGSGIFILKLTSPTTLRLEHQAAANCGAGSWAFTANAVDFQR